MEERKKAPAGSEFWQIIFPLILGLMLMIALAVAVVLELSPGNISRFAEISTVLVVIPYLGLSLLGAVLLVGLIALTVKIIQVIPTGTSKILEILDQIKGVIVKAAEYAVVPVIRPSSFLAGIKGIFKKSESKIKID